MVKPFPARVANWKTPDPTRILTDPTQQGSGAVLDTTRPTSSATPPITLYSTAICPYCVMAKNFLKSRGLEWNEVRIDTDPAERERMLARARRTSVPQIFIGEHHVGGYDDMIALHRAGKLDPLLQGSGA